MPGARPVHGGLGEVEVPEKFQGIYRLLIDSYRPVITEAVTAARRYVDASRRR